jgi:hypothetical protein
MVDLVVQFLLVDGDELKVVERIELCNFCWSRFLGTVVVDEPARDIGVQAIRNDIKKILWSFN